MSLLFSRRDCSVIFGEDFSSSNEAVGEISSYISCFLGGGGGGLPLDFGVFENGAGGGGGGRDLSEKDERC